jgi:hypothetical protein
MIFLLTLNVLLFYITASVKTVALRIDSNVAAVFTPFTKNGTVNYSVTRTILHINQATK